MVGLDEVDLPRASDACFFRFVLAFNAYFRTFLLFFDWLRAVLDHPDCAANVNFELIPVLWCTSARLCRKKSIFFYFSQKPGRQSGCQYEPDHKAATLPDRLPEQPDNLPGLWLK